MTANPTPSVPLQYIATRIGATMEQTGGWCFAAVKDLKNGETVVITEGPKGGWLLSLYLHGVWEESGEAEESFEWPSLFDVVKHVARLEGE